MTTKLPGDVAAKLEKHLIQQTKNRLFNWGRWWWEGNNLEIRLDARPITESPSYRLMQRGKVSTRSGYSESHRLPVNEEDALNLHQIIASGLLSPNEIAELRRYYSDKGGSGTSAQGVCRYRAVRKLAGLQ